MYKDDLFLLPTLLRHQEDGVQDATVAREVFLLRCVQERHRHQEFHPARAGDLLRRLLRGQVRHPLRQVPEGKTIFFSLR